MNITASFIGGGNMGGALIRGLIARGLAPQHINVGEASQARRIALADELGVHVSADNLEIVDGADIVVLAVKPQDMGTTVRPLAGTLAKRKPLVLSIAAGIRVSDIATWCGPGISVVRAMRPEPNSVWMASSRALACGRPNATAASVMSSASRKK